MHMVIFAQVQEMASGEVSTSLVPEGLAYLRCGCSTAIGLRQQMPSLQDHAAGRCTCDATLDTEPPDAHLEKQHCDTLVNCCHP